MTRSRTEVAREATILLEKCGVTKAPVPVRRIAAHLGAEVRREPLEGHVSGLIYIRHGQSPVIGVNSAHSKERQRFTIAHELGHLLFHADEGMHIDDRKQTFIAFRDAASSKGDDPNEVEANCFAAELLMPESLVRRDFQDFKLGTCPEDAIEALSRRYRVSVQSMTIRLTRLGLVW